MTLLNDHQAYSTPRWPRRRHVLAFAALAMLAACGGGDDSSEPDPAKPTLFGIAPGGSSKLDAMTAIAFELAGPGFVTEGTTFTSGFNGGATATLQAEAADLATVGTEIDGFVTGGAGTGGPRIEVNDMIDTFPLTRRLSVLEGSGVQVPNSQIQLVDPTALAFSAQTPGIVSLTVTGALAGTVVWGVSTGAATTALPTTGVVSYSVGRAVGIWKPADRTATQFAAEVNVVVDFAARSATWSLANARTGMDVIADPSTGVPDPQLAFSGTLTQDGTSRVLQGEIGAGGPLAMTVTGGAFGDSAEEIGGTFVASGVAGRLVGAYGARR